MEPLISIIVPVYKVEKYLDKCIESLVNQTYTNIEIILVNDGSPDRCPDICEKWKKIDDRIIVLKGCILYSQIAMTTFQRIM